MPTHRKSKGHVFGKWDCYLVHYVFIEKDYKVETPASRLPQLQFPDRNPLSYNESYN